MNKVDCSILVLNGTHQALRTALSLALMELAYTRRVMLALFYDGLAAWCRMARGEPVGAGPLPWCAMLEQGLARLPGGGLRGLWAECAELGEGGRLRVVACGASVEALGLSIDALVQERVVDDVVGLPTIWRLSEGARLLTI